MYNGVMVGNIGMLVSRHREGREESFERLMVREGMQQRYKVVRGWHEMFRICKCFIICKKAYSINFNLGTITGVYQPPPSRMLQIYV